MYVQMIEQSKGQSLLVMMVVAEIWLSLRNMTMFFIILIIYLTFLALLLIYSYTTSITVLRSKVNFTVRLMYWYINAMWEGLIFSASIHMDDHLKQRDDLVVRTFQLTFIIMNKFFDVRQQLIKSVCSIVRGDHGCIKFSDYLCGSKIFTFTACMAVVCLV